MPQQYYSGEADAKQAAKLAGLTEAQFEIVSGPKGFTYRKRKQYKKVQDAKLHVGKDPEKKIEDLSPTKVPDHPSIWKDPNGRFRWMDETEALSQESFETIEAAEKVLNQCIAAELAPKPTPLSDPVPIPGFVPGTQKEILPQTTQNDDSAAESPEDEEIVTLTEEKRMCPSCRRSIDTYVSGDNLRYIEHDDPTTSEGDTSVTVCNMSEEVVVPVVETGISSSELKPHEIAQIQNGSLERSTNEKVPAGLPHLKRSLIPNPSKTVWVVADQMITENPSVSRKEVIERCLGMRIAFHTARTQYQQWRQARRDSIKHAAEAPHIKID